jgi:hypothetical protein|tara:strand:- start:13558 stop:14256 length:699 start_codon:yes stop_codon:yes gene_type:complete
MSTNNDPGPNAPPAGAIRPDPSTPDGRDVLISRVIDAEATAEDWRAFRALASEDPGVWRDLADEQQRHERLCEGFRAAVCVADGVSLPLSGSDATPLQRRLDATARWGGWAAAAALVLVWATALPRAGAENPGLLRSSLLPRGPSLSEATPDEALARYLAAGQNAGVVVGEVPDRVVVETNARDDGSVEVLYVRQIIERRVTDQIYREIRDDTGRLVPVPVKASEIRPPRAF